MAKKIILLDSIRSMQNVGAIFRNADSAWFDKVILTWNCPYPPRNDISKTALGAENWIDWEFYKNWIEILEKLKKEWYKIFSIELTPESIDYRELVKEKEENICLIMWNEVSWVRKDFLEKSDKNYIIPMLWKKESLNVSVAAWIAMYALVD
jgi:tRNA G18 (ribose-2'-O)-methylase SpoU